MDHLNWPPRGDWHRCSSGIGRTRTVARDRLHLRRVVISGGTTDGQQGDRYIQAVICGACICCRWRPFGEDRPAAASNNYLVAGELLQVTFQDGGARVTQVPQAI